MKHAVHRFVWGILLVVLGAGCDRHVAEVHHATDGHASAGIGFKEGRGLTLNLEMVRALDLKTTAAEDRPVAAEMKILAQVFATAPQVLASASVTEADAEGLEKTAFNGARLVRLDRTCTTVTRRVDAIFGLERNPPRHVGEFVELTLAGEPRTALTLPRSAILDAAAGSFVYVVNSGHFLRVAVKLGAGAGEFVEVVDGIYSGDEVVTAPVNQLWLSELRLTKGGGHCH